MLGSSDLTWAVVEMPYGGPDTRTLVNNASAFPYSAIGLIYESDGLGNYYSGTGFLIDANHVLTAGHMVYNDQTGNFYQNITFTPEEQLGASPLGVYHAIAARTTTQFILNPGAIDESGDYGLLTLSTPIGNQTGWFNLSAATASLAGSAIYTAGYPGDLSRGFGLYSTSGHVLGLSYDLATDLDANHGQSGSPMWISTASGPSAVAVLHGLPTNPALDATGASGLTYPVIGAPVSTGMLNQISAWERLDAPVSPPSPPVPPPPPPPPPAPSATDAAIALEIAQDAPAFNGAYYLINNADLAAAGVNAMQHWVTVGWKEGRNPNAFFNTAYYLANNPDVRAAGIDPLQHYETYGWKELRNPSAAFNTATYFALNVDVALAQTNPLNHYLAFGIKEGRRIS